VQIEDLLKHATEQHPELNTVLESMTDFLAKSQRSTEQAISKKREEHLNLSPVTISVDGLRCFLDNYAPLQLVYDLKNSAVKFSLTRRMLLNASLLFTAKKVVEQTKDVVTNDGKDPLERLMNIDKRSTLPHAMWKSRHDAVLIRAIAKHGWIDNEHCCRQITEDNSIKWGIPFDSVDEKGDKGTTNVTPALLETANRAAQILNANENAPEEWKGFNLTLVARTYGLKRPGPTEKSPTSHRWVVDENQLQLMKGEDEGLAELPTKRDLVRRAKLVLPRLMNTERTEKQDESTPHGFAVLDQSSRCNVLLAELLRVVLKTPIHQAILMKSLCQLASREAKHLAPSTEESESCDDNVPLRICEQVSAIRSNMFKKSWQSKNLARVMLGEEPTKPKRASEEALFPKVRKSLSGKARRPSLDTKKSSKSSTTSAAKAPAPRSSQDQILEKPSGEDYIASARERYLTDGGRVGITDEKPIHLTEIEAHILLMLCTYGLPLIWAEHEAVPSILSNKSKFDWFDLGQLLASTSKAELVAAETALLKAKMALPRSKDHVFVHRQMEERALKQDVAAQALEYAAEPDTLAKKVLMLVSKIRQMWGFVVLGPKTSRSHNGLGNHTLDWLDKIMNRWATQLDLLDQRGKPLGFTATDFVNDVGSELRISAFLDKRGGRFVLAQIAMISRARCFVHSYSLSDLEIRAGTAVRAILKAEEHWNEPANWNVGNSQDRQSGNCSNDVQLLLSIARLGLSEECLKDVKEKCNVVRTLSQAMVLF